jgi:hypothetical protein
MKPLVLAASGSTVRILDGSQEKELIHLNLTVAIIRPLIHTVERKEYIP